MICSLKVNHHVVKPPVENVLEVVLFSGLGIQKCHGCKGEIVKKNVPALLKTLHFIWRPCASGKMEMCTFILTLHV